MTNLVGARRPALFLLFSLALAALVPCLASADSGTGTCPFYTMDRSGTLQTDGMMPPNYCGEPQAPKPRPTVAPNRRIPTARRVVVAQLATAAPTPLPRRTFRSGGETIVTIVPLVQTVHGHTYKYEALGQSGTYRISRDGEPWATVRYNAATNTWDLTDPNGSGYLLLRVGPKPRGH